jgi:hypothetical protein
MIDRYGHSPSWPAKLGNSDSPSSSWPGLTRPSVAERRYDGLATE